MSYVAPYRGTGPVLPPGFLEAATEPGRNYAKAMTSFADSINKGLEQRDNRLKAETFAAKSAEMLRKSLEMSKPDGVEIPDAQTFATLSAKDKAAWGQSTVASMHMAQQAQAMKESKQRMAFAEQSQGMHIDALKQQALDRELLNAAGQDLLKAEPMLEGQQGPPAIPEITPDRFLKAAAARGQLWNPQTDNILRSLEAGAGRARAKMQSGQAGSITTMPDGRQIFWNSPNSAQLVPGTGPKAGVDSAPEGWTTWEGPDGKVRLVKKGEKKPTIQEQTLQSSWMSAQSKVKSLQALKDAGATHFVADDNGQPVKASAWNPWGTSIDKELESQSRVAESSFSQLNMLRNGPGPEPGASTPPSAGPKPAEPQTGEMHGVARPTTKAEVMRLPAGAKFLNPSDGKVYIKK